MHVKKKLYKNTLDCKSNLLNNDFNINSNNLLSQVLETLKCLLMLLRTHRLQHTHTHTVSSTSCLCQMAPHKFKLYKAHFCCKCSNKIFAI